MIQRMSALAPHRPLDPGERAYVERSDEGGERIAEWIRAGKTTVLVAGPTGIGKSTEVAHAAWRLQQDHVACLVRIDRFENMREADPERVVLRIAARLICVAVEDLGLDVSASLREVLVSKSLLGAEYRKPNAACPVWSAATVAATAVREVTRLAHPRRVALLVDGLEKCSEPRARAIFDVLGSLPEEPALVVVVPWHAAYGPDAQDVIRPGAQFVCLRPVTVDGAEGQLGRRFLARVLAKHLEPDSLPDPLWSLLADPSQSQTGEARAIRECVETAIELSGGIPRNFLQLISDARSRALIRNHKDWPTREDVLDAAAQQRDSFRRLLLKGDDLALLEADGTDGRGIDLECKLRLLSHGMLLERMEQGRPVMRPHPLVRELLVQSAPHA